MGEPIVVNETIFQSKTGNTREGGGGGNIKNLLKKLGQLANKTLYEVGGDKKTNTIFERAKAVPGCAEMRGDCVANQWQRAIKKTLCRTNQELFKG